VDCGQNLAAQASTQRRSGEGESKARRLRASSVRALHAKGSNTELDCKVFVIGTATSGCQRLPGLAIELSSLACSGLAIASFPDKGQNGGGQDVRRCTGGRYSSGTSTLDEARDALHALGCVTDAFLFLETSSSRCGGRCGWRRGRRARVRRELDGWSMKHSIVFFLLETRLEKDGRRSTRERLGMNGGQRALRTEFTPRLRLAFHPGHPLCSIILCVPFM
jgi:hypothetical protein